MGVDVKINLPDNVRIKDVAYLIGIASGIKPEWEVTSHDPDHSWLRVPGVEVKQTSSVEMAEISIRSTGHVLVDGEDIHYLFYHFESSRGGRSLGPRSTAYWIAIAHRLVDFFGGTIDYQDCDNVEVDYKRPRKASRYNCPEDGDDYWNFYKRLSEVKPITEEEMQHFDKFAAYKISEMRR
jgi:hypothetical protein